MRTQEQLVDIKITSKVICIHLSALIYEQRLNLLKNKPAEGLLAILKSGREPEGHTYSYITQYISWGKMTTLKEKEKKKDGKRN